MLTTAGKTFATASTVGSEAGSACAKIGERDADSRSDGGSDQRLRNADPQAFIRGEVTERLSALSTCRARAMPSRLNAPCARRLPLI